MDPELRASFRGLHCSKALSVSHRVKMRTPFSSSLLFFGILLSSLNALVAGLGSSCSAPLGGGDSSASSPFWMQSITHQGSAPYGPAGYQVFRNVKVCFFGLSVVFTKLTETFQRTLVRKVTVSLMIQRPSSEHMSMLLETCAHHICF